MNKISRRDALTGIIGADAAAAKYVDAFMTNVNWEEVNRRVESLGKLT